MRETDAVIRGDFGMSAMIGKEFKMDLCGRE